MYTTLITAQQLQALLATNTPLMVFDCSYDLAQTALGRQSYLEQHIPGAVYADLGHDLSSHSEQHASGGRHPLPTREDFAAWLNTVGFRNHMQAVVYDRNGCNFCGRLWWMLKWAGHENVAVLDGGLASWQATGGTLASGSKKQNLASNFALANTAVKLVAIETVASQLQSNQQTLIDARATLRYLGQVEPLDPVAGHIPGAVNRPFTQNLAADGKFKPASQLRAEFTALLAGRDPATVVHYCGSGVSAVPNVLAMEIAGLGRAALYAGGWSQWCQFSPRNRQTD